MSHGLLSDLVLEFVLKPDGSDIRIESFEFGSWMQLKAVICVLVLNGSPPRGSSARRSKAGT